MAEKIEIIFVLFCVPPTRKSLIQNLMMRPRLVRYFARICRFETFFSSANFCAENLVAVCMFQYTC